jgi:hypothetical protein
MRDAERLIYNAIHRSLRFTIAAAEGPCKEVKIERGAGGGDPKFVKPSIPMQQVYLRVVDAVDSGKRLHNVFV